MTVARDASQILLSNIDNGKGGVAIITETLVTTRAESETYPKR